MSGRPDYTVNVKAKDAKYGTKVGAAWKTKDGSGINLKLDAGVSVATPEGVFLTLWPFETKEERDARFSGNGKSNGNSKPQTTADFGEDDIGF